MAVSRSELLDSGGLYPVVVPLDWKLIGAKGQDVTIPRVAGDPVHRILASGALLATEVTPKGPPEMMTFRQHGWSGALGQSVLSRYVEEVLDELAKQGLQPDLEEARIGNFIVSKEPSAKVVVNRMAPDGRQEIRYLARDRRKVWWELLYLVRRTNLDQWLPLLAEIEGVVAPQHQSSKQVH